MPRARARQGGLTLASDLSTESLGPLLHKLAKKPKAGIEGVSDLTRQQLTQVSAALLREVQVAIQAAGVLPDPSIDEDGQLPASKEGILLSLFGAAVLALELLTRSQQAPPEELLSAVTMLHDGVLMSNPDPDVQALHVEMQDAVMRVCCAWWERRLPGNELLVARTIPYVLMRAVGSLERNRATLVHSCYVIRDALELLDFEDETIADTKRLLLHTAMHPAFLKEPEGRRFVAGLFKLDPQMTRELAAIVRHQIPSGQRFALEAYGEILFRAWRDTVGPCAPEVESELQGLMQAAILASTPQLAAALRTVLNGLHNQKNLEKRLSPALVRLYDPILPRAFGAANAEVRRNALNLLVAAFPIMDSEAPAAENNTRLTQQLGLLMDCLTDPCPVVREAAVEGCCHCLKYFWEIIPAATSAKIIMDITSKLAFDGAARSVRIAVLRGLRALTDSQHAQPVLKKALPNISGLLHDKDPLVREALADLLVAVSVCRGLQFWAVVPLEQLLETLAEDTAPAVARKISRILVPSYFPNAQEGSARLGALLRSKPEAGLAFCRNIVARFFPEGDPRATSKSSGPEFTASIPTEHILQLAGDLAAHLLATAPEQPGTGARADRSPPAKRTKARRGGGKGAGAGAQAATGKKRAKKKEAEAVGEQEEGEDVVADNGAGGQEGAALHASEDEDAVVQRDTIETVEAWVAILEGLVVVAQGLGATVCSDEECGPADVEAVLPMETLTQLLQVAEEQVRNPRAVKLVLQLAVAVHFTRGAQAVRNVLFERLAEGTLLGLGGGTNEEVMELDGHRGPRGQDVDILAEILKTLSSGSNGPKLAAILSAALGVRQPMLIRKPVEKKKATGKAGKRGHAAGEDLSGGGPEALSSLLGMDPSGHGHEHKHDGDDIICDGCRHAQPEDTMLLCDGCDAACHIHCLKPALQAIPETDYFCWRCESQLQEVQLPAAAAARCVGLLLQQDGGRELLCEHPDLSAMIQAMHQLAMLEADEIVRVAQSGGADEAEADSGPAGTPPHGGPTEDIPTLLLGDPWGALARYCRAALHRALWAAMPKPAADQDADADDAPVPAAAPTPYRTPASVGRRRRGRRGRASAAYALDPAAEAAGAARADGVQQQLSHGAAMEDGLAGFYEIVPVIDCAVQTCVHLSELVLAEPCLAAQLAALQYSYGVLRVLYVIHQTDLLCLNSQYVATVSLLCTVQATLAQAAATVLAANGSDACDDGIPHSRAVLAGTIQAVLCLTHQLVAAVRSGTAGDGSGSGFGAGGALAGALTPGAALASIRRRAAGTGPFSVRKGAASAAAAAAVGEALEDSDDLPSQQLEARMDAAAGVLGSVGCEERKDGSDEAGRQDREAMDGVEVEELPPAVSVERLAVALVTLLCDTAVAGLLKGAVRVSAANLVGELLSATRRAEAYGWLDTLCRLTGEAITGNPLVASELQDIMRLSGNGHNIKAKGDDGDAGENADGPGDGPDCDEAANGMAVPEGEEEDAAGAGTVREVRRRPRGGMAAGGGAGGKQATAGDAASKAKLEVATRLAELLQKESPAVGTMATVLVRVCTARKAHGHTMLLLARLAASTSTKAPSAPAAKAAAAPDADLLASPAPQSTDGDDHGQADSDVAVAALGAAVLLTLCRAAAPAGEAPAAHPAAGRRRAAGRCGTLAQEAAAQADRAEVEAAAKALAVLGRVLDDIRALQPLQPGQQQRQAAFDADGVEEGPVAARGLACCVVRALLQREGLWVSGGEGVPGRHR